MALAITPAAERGEGPLGLYETRELASATTDDGERLLILEGLSEALAADLKRKSTDETDEELMKGTSDRRRFGEGSYEAWFAKERYPYALAKGEELAALVWFGPEALPGGFSAPGTEGKSATLAFRSYSPYRGKRLMGDFSRFAIDAYKARHPGRTLWLQTNADNAPAIRLYEKLGFTAAGTWGDNGRLVMIEA